MKLLNAITIPIEIYAAIQSGAAIAISISGGKDSQALLRAVWEYHQSEKLTNPIFAIHADLGSVEWKQTPAWIEKICRDIGIELVIVRRKYKGKPQGLLERWKQRKEAMKGRNEPFWSSSKSRYCTSSMKIEPINQYLRKFDNIISVEGIRWEESEARSKKPAWKVRKEITTKKRKAYTWNAIIGWSMEDVWESYGQSEESLKRARAYYIQHNTVPSWWNFHPAYAMGNDRLSCALCVLANKNDRINGVKHNPELAAEISALEKETGFGFWSKKETVTQLIQNNQ